LLFLNLLEAKIGAYIIFYQIEIQIQAVQRLHLKWPVARNYHSVLNVAKRARLH